MIIVVEGPDGSGKNTLISELRKTKKYHAVLERSGPPACPEDVYRVTQFINQHPKDLLLICNRIPCISERVYGPVLRGRNFMEPFPIMTGLSHVKLIVYCRPPDGVIRENLGARPQLEGVPTRINELMEAYDEIFHQLKTETSVPISIYNYTMWKSGQSYWEHIFAKLEIEAAVKKSKSTGE